MCGYRHTIPTDAFFFFFWCANATGSNGGLNRCGTIFSSRRNRCVFAYSKWQQRLNRIRQSGPQHRLTFHSKCHLVSHNTFNVYIFNAYLHTANIYQLSRARSILLSLSTVQHIHPNNGYSGYMKIIKIIMNEQKQHWNCWEKQRLSKKKEKKKKNIIGKMRRNSAVLQRKPAKRAKKTETKTSARKRRTSIQPNARGKWQEVEME